MIYRLLLAVLICGGFGMTEATAQNEDVRYDQNWYFGYSGHSGHSAFGLNWLGFAGGAPVLDSVDNSFFESYSTNIAISDADGNTAFMSNGCYIVDASHQLMQGGDTISPSQYTTDNYFIGHFIPQGVLALPHPGDDDKWDVIHNYAQYGGATGVTAPKLFHSTIDMSLNGGLGAVTSANQVVLEGDLDVNKTACRHANGRDWWILMLEGHSDRYYRLLLDPQGLHVVDTAYMTDSIKAGLGQAVFSPDGSKFVVYNSISSSEGTFLNIFDFDRVTGELSNQVTIHDTIEEHTGGAGAAISPNSRYLYISSSIVVYQYDLWADDIEASRVIVGEYDNFVTEFGFGTRFYTSQLGPDGKIYITCPAATRFLHVIHEPDSAGLACNLELRGQPLYFMAQSMPNHPHYRLGRLVGSVADTVYNTTAVVPVVEEEVLVRVFPNPTRGQVTISMTVAPVAAAQLQLYDLTGRLLLEQPLAGIDMTVDLPRQLASGTYIVRIASRNRVLHTQKLVLLE